MSLMSDKKAFEGWLSSAEKVVKTNPSSRADAARETTRRFRQIFEERQPKRPGAREQIPRFYVPRPPPASVSAEGVDDSGIAVARSILRAKARSRFLQRQEDALMGIEDISEIEQALAACAASAAAQGDGQDGTTTPGASIGDTNADTTSASEGSDSTGGSHGCDGRMSNGDRKSDGATGVRFEGRNDADEGQNSVAGTAVAAPERADIVMAPSGEERATGDDRTVGDDCGEWAKDDGQSVGVAKGGGLRSHEAGNDAKEESMDYSDFVSVRSVVSRKAAPFLTPRTFIWCSRDVRGRIPSEMLIRLLYESHSLQKIKLTLNFYDSDGLGYLLERDLENYVHDHIPTISALQPLQENFYPFYIFTAVRRFMFFLDPRRTGKISIDALVRSRVMEEFVELRSSGSISASESECGDDGVEDVGSSGSADSPPTAATDQDMSGNWFSAENTLRIYSEYLDLDEDQNGMLSKKELLRFGYRQQIRLTPTFVQRLFEEVVTYRVPSSSSSSSSLTTRLDRSRESPPPRLQEGGDAECLSPPPARPFAPPPSVQQEAGTALLGTCTSMPRDGLPKDPASQAPLPIPSPLSLLLSPLLSPPASPLTSSPTSPTPPAPTSAVTSTPLLACPVPVAAPSLRRLLPLSSTGPPSRSPTSSPPPSILPPLFPSAVATATTVPRETVSPPRETVSPPRETVSPPRSPVARISPEGEDIGSRVPGESCSRSEAGWKEKRRRRRRTRRPDGELDYKTFLDLVLAMENKQTRQAMKYFWRVLDVDCTGRLTVGTINLFFRDVERMLKERGHEPPLIADVKDEIFDMVKPKDPAFIAFDDLLDSGVGHTVVSMLVDTNGFLLYDNRESLSAFSDEEDPPAYDDVPAVVLPPATTPPALFATDFPPPPAMSASASPTKDCPSLSTEGAEGGRSEIQSRLTLTAPPQQRSD